MFYINVLSARLSIDKYDWSYRIAFKRAKVIAKVIDYWQWNHLILGDLSIRHKVGDDQVGDPVLEWLDSFYSEKLLSRISGRRESD